jgi:hypothetical protein
MVIGGRLSSALMFCMALASRPPSITAQQQASPLIPTVASSMCDCWELQPLDFLLIQERLYDYVGAINLNGLIFGY